MSGLILAAASQNPTGHNPYGTPLLTDARREPLSQPQRETEQARPIRNEPPHATPAMGTYAHIQAQILGSNGLGPNGQRSFRRPTANSPREAARAYGQARRRPQTVSDMPRLQNVI